MSITSNCPKCLKQVTIPAGVTDETVVRCPLCEAEYAGRESLSMVPPALIIVSPAPTTLVSEALTNEPVEMAVAADGQSHEDAWGGEPPTAVVGHDSADPWSRIPDEEDEADVDEDRDGIPLREEDADEEDEHVATRDGGVAIDVGPPAKRRKRRQPNLIIRFIGIAVSGAMALPAVYGIGILVKGRQFDRQNLNVLRFFSSEENVEPAPAVEADKPAKPAGDAIGFLTDDGPGTKPKGPTDPGVKQPPVAGKNDAKVAPGAKPKTGEAVEVDFSKPLEPDDPMDQPAGKDSLDPGGSGLDLPKPDQPEFKPIGSIGEKPAPETKPEAKPEPKAEPQPPEEPKVPAAKEPAVPEVKPEPKPEPQPEVKPEPKPEPKVEEKPEPKAEPKPARLGPINRPNFGEAEVSDAAKAAQAAFGCVACASKGTVTKDGKEEPCEVCKGKPSTDISPETYEKLRRVAEMATFAPATGAAADDIAQLAERIARSPEASQKVVEASKPLLANPAPGGILLVGTVLKVVEKGGIHGAAVKTDAAAKPVPVMLDRALPIKEGDRVLVLGSVVVEPAKNVAGYAGTQPMIVWLGMAVKQ